MKFIILIVIICFGYIIKFLSVKHKIKIERLNQNYSSVNLVSRYQIDNARERLAN